MRACDVALSSRCSASTTVNSLSTFNPIIVWPGVWGPNDDAPTATNDELQPTTTSTSPTARGEC